MPSDDHNDVVFDNTLDDDDDNDESQSQDDEEEEEEDVALNDDVLLDDDDDVDENLNYPSSAAAVTVTNTTTTAVNNSAVAAPDGIPIPVALPTPISAVTVASVPNGGDDGRKRSDRVVETAATTVTPTAITIVKPPAVLDDSRRLFQRLWTDEDEIELLQGFLEYTTQRGSSGGGHHDTSLFYDQIKSKLQLDFNKNQLVEKLRRLKKKYRNVVNKLNSGKEFTFKSPHDQATFEISKRIWCDSVVRGSGGGGSSAVVNASVEDMDDEDAQMNFCNIEVKSEDFAGERKNMMMMMTPGSSKSSRSKKRSRSKLDIGYDDRRSGYCNDGFIHNVVFENSGAGAGAGIGTGVGGSGSGSGAGNGNAGAVAAGVAAGVIEETVKSCLSPLFKELLNGAMMGMGAGGGGVFGGRGIGGLAMNAMPLNFGISTVGIGSGDAAVDERWRKQQILELEVYSKRLELVQDQIKASLQELRSMGD